MTEQSKMGPLRLEAMIDSQFASVYLTLLSIIQSVALGFLATEVIDVVRVGVVQLDTGLLLGANFLFLILVWHLSMKGLLRRKWDPDILDGTLLFFLGLLECILMSVVDYPEAWLRFMGMSLFVGALINVVAYWRLRKRDLEDASNFEEMRSNLLKRSILPWLAASVLLFFVAPAVEGKCPGAFVFFVVALIAWGIVTAVSYNLQRVQWK